MMKVILKSTAMLLTLFIQVFSTQAQTAKTPYVTGQLIVKFKAGKTAKTNHLITQLNAKRIENLPNQDVQIWELENKQASTDMEALAESYANHPDIEFIEPNYLYTTSDVQEIPNDTNFNQQWALHNTGELEGSVEDADIDAPEAWAIQSESPSIVVGIIDTGVDWRHPDLIDNIWQNLAEDIDGDSVVIQYDTLLGRWVFDPDDINGEDDDGNGYADDFIGWNFIDNNNQPFDYEGAEDGYYVQSHGTHVAGIIGASGNNQIGVSGVTNKVQLALLKFLSDDPIPEGTAANAIAAIDYAVNMNMQISNNSWGGSKYSSAVKESIIKAAANNHLFVAAAGNGGEDKIGDNNDAYDFFPANYGFHKPINSYEHESIKNIIAVANSNYSDTLSASSNFGANAVDIAAPGSSIFSCMPFGYGWLNGTSMATPHVTGTCALLWQRGIELYESINYDIIKELVINNVDTLSAFQLKNKSNGRLNMHQSLLAIEKPSFQDLHKNCRQRDSLTLRVINQSLNLDQWFPTPLDNGTFDFYYDTWDLTQPIDTWRGVTLNSMGCVTHLNLIRRRYYNQEEFISQIPPEIGNLSELVELVLNNGMSNGLYYDDRIYMDSIEINEKISRLNLSEATGILPSEIGKLSKLKKLVLKGKLFAGSIPPELGKLQQLNYLDLSINNLSGHIPIELMDLFRLLTLNLSYNNLQGKLPEELHNLLSLNALNLFSNKLTGSIPNSFKHLRLNNLDLGYNDFTGNIPASIGYIQEMQFLFLDHNKLVGSIPPEFSNLQNLELTDGINISYNQLSGCYDPYLNYLGGWMFPDYGGTNIYDGAGNLYNNYQISDGNMFDADWENFEDGTCWASEVSRVWPGDFNNDGKVNQKDIVFYGFATGKSGPNREILDTTWTGHLCPDWNSQVLGINGKHQDADGNGLVDTIDYGLIIQNWGKINPNHYNGTGDLRYVSNGIELVLEPVESEPDGTYDLFLKRVENTNTPVYGIAGTIEFNLPISPESTIKFDESCLASDGTFADFKFNFENTVLEFGLTQTDNVNIVCDGAMARLIIIIEDIMIEGGNQFLTFKVNALTSEANSQSGGEINEAIGASMSQTLQVPSNNNLNMRVATKPQICGYGGEATPYISGGSWPYQYSWSTGETTNIINNLVAGTYELIVTDAAGITDTITVEIDDQQIPEYDENGELKSCEMNIISTCPNNIDFDRNIINDDYVVEQGTYSVHKTIKTSGKILENEKVDLQAGEKISLKPGFTMQPDASLNILIQNCNEE